MSKRYEFAHEYERRFFEWAGIEIAEAGGGRARLRMTVAPQHRGGGGTDAVNGGIAAYLFDGALGTAVRSTWDEGVIEQVTMTLTIQYLRPLRAQGAVTAEAWVTHRGRSAVYVTGEIRDDQDQPCMTAIGIFHLIRAHAH